MVVVRPLFSFLLLAGILCTSSFQPITAAESNAEQLAKKVLKIVWHGGEVFAGGVLAFIFFEDCKHRSWCPWGITMSLGSVSLLIHGFAGLDKELEISKLLDNLR